MRPEEENHLGYLISDTARLLRTVFDRRVRALGLTRAQWLVLTRLHRRPGSSQSELAEMMEVEKATAGRHLDRLERKGWIERRADKIDRRIKRIYLTQEAERVHRRMWRVAEDTVEDALHDLSAAEAAALLDLMRRVKGRLQMLSNEDTLRRGSQTKQPGREGRGNGASHSMSAGNGNGGTRRRNGRSIAPAAADLDEVMAS
jgi:DNA-binding MarR family transcriptional regulator